MFRKIKTKLLFMTVLSIVLVTGISTMIFVSNLHKLSENSIHEYKEELLKARKSELKAQIDTASKAIESFYERSTKENISSSVKEKSEEFLEILNNFYQKNKNKMSENQLKAELKKFVRTYRYDHGIGYFWINDFNYKMVMHPIKPSLDGRKFINTPKVPFVELAVNGIKKSKTNSAVISYEFFNPKSKKYEYKISNVFVFKPFNWIFGTGAYRSYLEHKLQEEAKKVIGALRYGKSGYFWINDIDGNMVSHPKSHLIGNNYANDKKVPFVQLGMDLAKKKKEGFVSYDFPKANSNKPEPKLSYIKYFPQWKWMIGTGTYIDDIEKHGALYEKENNKEISQMVFNLILLLIPVTIVIIGINIFFNSRNVLTPIETLRSVAKNLSSGDGDLTKRITLKGKDELADAAFEINLFIEKIQSTIKEAKRSSTENASVSDELTATANNIGQRVEQSSDIISNTAKKANSMGEILEQSVVDAVKTSEDIEEADKMLSDVKND
ncbi:MAG: methyl-accepting chemotaxis protein, partial [Campylobacterales bacterium]|nr:methyl-accepting chemotaxis protein [Campylobacterales bacterium]